MVTEPDEHLHPGGRRRRIVRRERPCQPLPALAEMSMIVPEPGECPREPHADCRVAGLRVTPRERCPQVIVLCFQPREPLPLLCATPDALLCLFCQDQVV